MARAFIFTVSRSARHGRLVLEGLTLGAWQEPARLPGHFHLRLALEGLTLGTKARGNRETFGIGASLNKARSKIELKFYTVFF
jgi:hypothetical protein